MAETVFASGSTIDSFNDHLLIPVDRHREKLIEILDDMAESDRWLGAHARRTTFVCSAISSRKEMDNDREASIRIASLMLNTGLTDQVKKDARDDLFLSRDEEKLEDLATGYNKSAELVRSELENERAAKIIDAVAGIIRRKPATTDKEIEEDAKCVLATELMDRACWGGGIWNPSGAYRSMRDFKGRSSYIDDDETLETVARVLGEAVSTGGAIPSMSPPPLDPVQRKQRQEILAAAQEEAKEKFGKSRKSKVKLCDLKEGMKIADPVVSFDGQVLLPPGSVLDRDMIWRLWQLMIIRPIESPISVILPDLVV